MRTISIYTFDELSDESKSKAIESVREQMKENGHDQFAFRYAIDDCALFEPAHQEMEEILGRDYFERNRTSDGKYGQFVFKNKRKVIYWDEARQMAAIAEALEITNVPMFLTWLGIPERLHGYVYYEMEDRGTQTRLYLSHDLLSDNPMCEAFAQIFDTATKKFDAHISEISHRIAQGMEVYYNDDEIEEKIGDSDYEFNEDGTIFE
jgi:hypothetical protein